MPAGETPPPARDCYRFALSNPAVDMVLCGPKNREQMQEALRALDAGPLAPDELKRLHRIGDHIYGRYRPQFAEQGDRHVALPAERRPAILAYTAKRWGHLCDPARRARPRLPPPARDCYRFALSNPSVDMVLCGPRNREQMQEALRALEAGPLAPDEMKRLQRIGDHIYGRYRPQFAEKGDRIALPSPA